MQFRASIQRLQKLAATFKIVAVTGPRQSGKTTLLKAFFSDKPYVSLENPDTRTFAINDPRGFLAMYANGAVLDEVQRVPELFSYIQEVADNSQQKGLFILSGSNNFLLDAHISQSLAGRVGYLNLLPFSLKELTEFRGNAFTDNDLILNGFYPPVYDQQIPIQDWCANYIRTYIERDVRQVKNIGDLLVFERFLALLAGRCGQELNYTAISNEAGIDVKTVESWIGVLESSYLIFLLKPHFANFNKTVVKRPKLFFCDVAIVTYLLRIRTQEQLQTHPLRGALFENLVVTEYLKLRTNAGMPVNLYYWRDKTGHEV